MRHKSDSVSEPSDVGSTPRERIPAFEVDQLTCLAYDELKRLAAYFLNQERRGHTLQPTALVHEAYLRLTKQKTVQWQSKAQFLAVAAQAMRRILVEHARNRVRLKRGGQRKKISLEDAPIFSAEHSADLVALDKSLNRLSVIDSRQAEIVELRFFGGLSVEETAATLSISPITVKRDWSIAKAWLYGDLKEQYGAAAGTLGRGQDPL